MTPDRTEQERAKHTVLPPRKCDPEVAAIMDELSKLQTWLVLQGARPGGRLEMAAADLVQRTRCLIVERCFERGDHHAE